MFALGFQVYSLLTYTLYEIEKYHFCSVLKTNQFSFKDIYKVLTYLKLIKHSKSRGTILDLDAHFAGFDLYR